MTGGPLSIGDKQDLSDQYFSTAVRRCAVGVQVGRPDVQDLVETVVHVGPRETVGLRDASDVLVQLGAGRGVRELDSHLRIHVTWVEWGPRERNDARLEKRRLSVKIVQHPDDEVLDELPVTRKPCWRPDDRLRSVQ